MARDIISGIYQIKNAANGKLYIGGATNVHARWNRHKHNLRKGNHHSIKLQRAWDKYGEDSFDFELILICDKTNLQMYEQILLDWYRPNEYGYNIEAFARTSLGRKHSVETRARLSEIAKNRICSLETRAKLSAAGIGRKQKPESIAKTRAAILGKPKSEETKAKLSAAMRGRLLTPEHKAKISPFGRKHSEETKQKMAESRRRYWESKQQASLYKEK